MKSIKFLLDVDLRCNWNDLMNQTKRDEFESAKLILGAKPYVGRFAVYEDNSIKSLSRVNFKGRIEMKCAILYLSERQNIAAIQSKSKSVHAHLENGHYVYYNRQRITDIE